MPRQELKFSRVPCAQTAQQNSSLLALPAEMRNYIYRLTFNGVVFDTQAGRYFSSRVSKYRTCTDGAAPGLLLACRQTHAEALPIFYSRSIFFTTGSLDFDYWCRKIGSIRKKYINHVNFKLDPARSIRLRGGVWVEHYQIEDESWVEIDQAYIDELYLQMIGSWGEEHKTCITDLTRVKPSAITVSIHLGGNYFAEMLWPIAELVTFCEYKDLRDMGRDMSKVLEYAPWFDEWYKKGSFTWRGNAETTPRSGGSWLST